MRWGVYQVLKGISWGDVSYVPGELVSLEGWPDLERMEFIEGAIERVYSDPVEPASPTEADDPPDKDGE